MERLGVSTDPEDPVFRPAEMKYEPLLSSRESINRLKDLAIEHNISVMKIFNDEVAFGNLLEAARSEKQWKQVRAYINIFYEYSTYMTQKQKQMTMHFLYELLMHSEGISGGWPPRSWESLSPISMRSIGKKFPTGWT